MAPKKFNKGSWCCSKKFCASLVSSPAVRPNFEFSSKLDRNFVCAQFGKKTVNCIIDSGAAISCISRHFLKKVEPDAKIVYSNIATVRGVCGEIHSVLGECELDFCIENVILRQKFRIFETLHAKVILGIDFLQHHYVQADFGTMTLTFPRPVTEAAGNTTSSYVTVQAFLDPNPPISKVTVCQETIVPPHSEILMQVQVQSLPNDSTFLIEPIKDLSISHSLAGGRTITTEQNGKCTYRLLNPTSLPVMLKAQTHIARAQIVNSQNISPLNSVNINSIS